MQMTCILCQEHLFLFTYSQYVDLPNTANISIPNYYINVEFSKLEVLKCTQGFKHGFALEVKGRRHQFVIKLPE